MAAAQFGNCKNGGACQDRGMKWFFTWVLALGLAGSARCAEAAPIAFHAKDVSGRDCAAAEAGAAATVWIFLSHDCPICNAYAPELNRIFAEYQPRGVRIKFVFAEAGLALADLRAHASAYALKAPLFRDADFRIALACGAISTPEAAVIDARSRLAYRGRIDDRFAGLGSERGQIDSHNLREALDAILAGRAVPHPRTLAVGCALELPLKPQPGQP
jgi:hypothetical protein